MTTYQTVYDDLIAPAIMVVNTTLKTSYPLEGGEIQTITADTSTGSARYVVDLLLSSSILIRVYYYNEGETYADVIHQEQYVSNNDTIFPIFILHRGYDPSTIRVVMNTLIKKLTSDGAEYQKFDTYNFILSLTDGISMLVDHLGNFITDTDGNVITL